MAGAEAVVLHCRPERAMGPLSRVSMFRFSDTASLQDSQFFLTDQSSCICADAADASDEQIPLWMKNVAKSRTADVDQALEQVITYVIFLLRYEILIN